MSIYYFFNMLLFTLPKCKFQSIESRLNFDNFRLLFRQFICFSKMYQYKFQFIESRVDYVCFRIWTSLFFSVLIYAFVLQPLDLMRLWHRFCELHPSQNFPVMYTAYHHFRSKGWTVRSGINYGVDYGIVSYLFKPYTQVTPRAIYNNVIILIQSCN